MHPSKQSQRKENLLLNIGCNVAVPVIILMNFSGDQYLGITWSLIVALAFPIAYGINEYIATRKINFFSILGLISVLLTGGIGLLKLKPEYLAIKEASIPGLIGIATIISLKTKYPLVRTLIYNDTLLNVAKVAEHLKQNDNLCAFNRVLVNATYILAASFFLSSALNYFLARWIVTADAGTELFNQQLGEMTALSFLVIMLPTMIVSVSAIIYLFRSIKRLTQLTLEDIVAHPPST